MSDLEKLFNDAEAAFIDNDYEHAEDKLMALVRENSRKPEVYHMLGTLFYDQGKFKKAIKSFETALEIDPSFTDSSVGLSIILNDLGRYEDGQRVFNEAKLMLAQANKGSEKHLDEKFASKHCELGELYYRHQRYEQAMIEFQKALSLSERELDINLQIVDCLVEMERRSDAIRILKHILAEQPHYVPALLRLGKSHYDLKQIPEAIDCWERVLDKEPTNKTATNYLKLVQTVQLTSVNEPLLEL